MKKKHLMIGLISFTTLTTFAVATPVEAAMMGTETYENHGQYVRSHATHLRHHEEDEHLMNGVSMHARDKNENLSCSAEKMDPALSLDHIAK